MGIASKTIARIAIAALGIVAPAANAQVLISNGVIKMGIRPFGNLNAPDLPSVSNDNALTGLRYLKSGASGELEYTSQGSPWEGWGVAYNGSVTGWVNFGGTGGTGPGLLFAGFSSTATTATAQSFAGALAVSHAFQPSSVPNLYEVNVTLTNQSGAPINNVRYRRAFDWDADPTPFDEAVEIGGWPASALVGSNTGTFNVPDPLQALVGPFPNQNATFAQTGFADQGAVFDFDFGTLPAGGTKSFTIFFGANVSRAATINDLASVGAEVYSLTAPNVATTHPDYSVAAFAFKGVGGTALSTEAPEPGTAALLGLGLLGITATVRLRRNSP